MNMMLVPRRNNLDLFDDFFNDDFFNRRESSLMKTDIKETKNKYLVDVDLPGFKKENISLSLDDGYLNIEAKVDKEENNDKDERFVRRERFHGECARSFYVGKDIKEEDIKAEFKDGILKVEVPKISEEEKAKEVKQIDIK